jgi:hypothetical protein
MDKLLFIILISLQISIIAIALYFKYLSNSHAKREGELEAELGIIKELSGDILSHTKPLEELKENVWRNNKQWEFKRQIYLDLISNISTLGWHQAELRSIMYDNDGNKFKANAKNKARIDQTLENIRTEIIELAKNDVNSSLVLSTEIQYELSVLSSEMYKVPDYYSFESLNSNCENLISFSQKIAEIAKQDLLT